MYDRVDGRAEFFRTYKMKIISLLINLFAIIKTKALECVSVVNQKCIPNLEYLT